MLSTPHSVDTRQVRHNFTKAAANYNAVSLIQREIARRMLERLDFIRIQPQRILDLGCGTGFDLTALGERYPKAHVVGVDFCEAMLRAGLPERKHVRRVLPFLKSNKSSLICADITHLPLPCASADLAWSNLAIHWIDDIPRAINEMYQAIRTDGLIMFSTLGPDSLKELRSAFSDGCQHTQHFMDMHDYGDLLLASGFSDPVMDVDRLILTYSTLNDLFQDLRRNGAACAAHNRRRGLMGKQSWQSMQTRYEDYRQDGYYPASFEIIYGHAWKGASTKTGDGESIIHFDSKRHRL